MHKNCAMDNYCLNYTSQTVKIFVILRVFFDDSSWTCPHAKFWGWNSIKMAAYWPYISLYGKSESYHTLNRYVYKSSIYHYMHKISMNLVPTCLVFLFAAIFLPLRINFTLKNEFLLPWRMIFTPKNEHFTLKNE